MERLIAVLASIASAQSAFDIKGQAQQDGSYRITSRAEITSFSDNIVVSYPVLTGLEGAPPEAQQFILDGWHAMVRSQMEKITAQVAMAGLELGLLVRGGLTRGKLYHLGGVVVGKGMVDAYKLERDVAVGARVVVDPAIQDHARLVKDEDGHWCLDFITELMLLADDTRGGAIKWAQERLVEIDASISDLNSKGLSKIGGKWEGFRDRLQYAKNTWRANS